MLDIVFPRLSGGLVSALNRKMFQFNSATAVGEALVGQTNQKKSMLFEIAVAYAEQIVVGDDDPDLSRSISLATARQQSHFDAHPPQPLTEVDVDIIQRVSSNLVNVLTDFAAQQGTAVVVVRPRIPGFGWVGSGLGDFAIEDTLSLR